MNIYIDEAGSFIPSSRPNYINCIAAIIVPSAVEKYLFDEYLQLRTSWGSSKSEIKGSKLEEKQVKRALQLLHKYDVLAEVTGIGTTDLDEDSITAMKVTHAKAITGNITPEVNSQLADSLRKAEAQFLSTSNQLYLQHYAQTRVCDRIIRTGTGFWSQRAPAELGNFQWRIDAKNKTITEAEELWSKLSKPFLESASLSNPGPIVDSPEFDYSHFERFRMDEDGDDEEASRHLKFLRSIKGRPDSKPMSGIDLKALFADLKFANSEDSVGLQLADIVASAFHRACKGTLQREGWIWLAPLFVNKREAVIEVLTISNDPKSLQRQMEKNEHMLDVLTSLKDGARSMMKN